MWSLNIIAGEGRKKELDMFKILERWDGKNVWLVCNGVLQEGEVSINLIGNGKKLSTAAWLPHCTECFSERTTSLLILPWYFVIGKTGHK